MTINATRWIKYQHYRAVCHDVVIPAMESIGELGQVVQLKQCGKHINVIECDNCGTQHFAGHWSCHNRWCPNCAYKRVLCWMARLLPIMEQWYADGNYMSMLNFTVRDGMPLKQPLDLLEQSYRRMYHDRANRKQWDVRFPGGVRSLEVKLGKRSKQWHPHYHCLVMQPGEGYCKDYDWLSDAWHKIVGHNGRRVTRRDGTEDWDYNGNLYIKQIRQDKGDTRNGGILNAVKETLKYIVKVDGSLDSNRVVNFYRDKTLFADAYYTLRGKRQTSTWGLLYGLAAKIDKDMAAESLDNLISFVCQRCGCTEGKLLQLLYDCLDNDTVLLDIINPMANPKKPKKITHQNGQ